MKAATYRSSGTPVQGSFSYRGHENLAVTDTPSTSEPILDDEVILSLVVAAHVRIGGGDASVSNMVLPAGVWSLSIPSGSTISVLKLTGAESGQASIIFVEK